MTREAFLSPSKRHFDKSWGVVIVLVRNTRAPSMTQISVSVPPLSMLMSRLASSETSWRGVLPVPALTAPLNSPEFCNVAFIVDSPSRIAEPHQRRVGQISIVNTRIIDAHGVSPRDRANLLQSGHPPRLNIEDMNMRPRPIRVRTIQDRFPRRIVKCIGAVE